MSSDREAWASFWKAGGVGGCLPCAVGSIEAAQRATWEAFARPLPRGSRILDLGTGNGAVLVRMARVRPDLKLTGVDASPQLPPSPKGVSLQADVRIEQLPFPARSFDAVTAQFGYEYGDTALASLEVARVLKPGGVFRFMIHRRDGPVLAHNLSRRAALAWALAPGGWLEKARALAAARAVARIPTPPAFAEAVREARHRFPHQSVAAEIATAIVQALELDQRSPEASAAALRALETGARHEIARIDSLDRAACDAGRLAEIAGELESAGLQIDPPAELAGRQSGHAFAWLLSGSVGADRR